jgi:pimeloyl-ACP methyl ester carboxylesterase
MRRRFLALAIAVALSLPVLPAQAQEAHPLAVVLVGGYGSDFDEASGHFSALRAAILERSPDAVVVQYSYAGTSFDGCSAFPSPYARADTAQDIETSKQILRDTVAGLESDCDVARVAIVGHSLGGLIAFQTADGTSLPKVSDVVTVDSPLGGVPQRLVETCISIGFCVDGAVADYLATLYPRSAAIAQDNAAHVAALSDAGIHVSAWGNANDCFYDVALCASFARAVFGALDARDTQWLGMPDSVHKDYPVVRGLAGIGASHTAVLAQAAHELAIALIPE